MLHFGMNSYVIIAWCAWILVSLLMAGIFFPTLRVSWVPKLNFLSICSLMRELLASIACNDLLHPIHLVNKMREESAAFKSVPLALSQLSPLSTAEKTGRMTSSSVTLIDRWNETRRRIRYSWQHLSPSHLFLSSFAVTGSSNPTSRDRRSLYREILFLTIAAYGIEDIDLSKFPLLLSSAFLGLAFGLWPAPPFPKYCPSLSFQFYRGFWLEIQASFRIGAARSGSQVDFTQARRSSWHIGIVVPELLRNFVPKIGHLMSLPNVPRKEAWKPR